MCRVVRCFLGDLNVMRMALQQSGIGDLHELCLFVEQLDGLAAAVTHTGADIKGRDMTTGKLRHIVVHYANKR